MRFLSFNVIWKRVKAIKYMMTDRTVPIWKKALVIFGVIYLLMPFDLVPIVVFPIGIMDDIILWIWILITLRDTLDSYWVGEKEEDLSKDFSGKNIIDDVKYDVDKGERNE
jgi:uncharacterized membrane protein YkvA (DUF1232 family)